MVVRSKKADSEFPIPFITRRTPVLLLIRSLLVIFLLQALYVVIRIIGPDLELDVSGTWIFGTIVLLQVAAIALLALRWYFESYEIHRLEVIHRKGVLFRHEEAYPYNNIQKIVSDQSPLGRIYHYGRVKMFVPTLGRDLVFEEIPHPHHFMHTIKHVLPYPDRQRFIVQG